MKKLDDVLKKTEGLNTIDSVVTYHNGKPIETEKEQKTYKKSIRLRRTKYLLGVLGLSGGVSLAEADTLDRLNDFGVINTPTSVSYKTGSHASILDVLTNNPYFHTISRFFYSIGISGGPNNTLGILAAAGLLVIGGVSAKAYLHSADVSGKYAEKKAGRGIAYISAALLGSGLYAGSQSFLPVINDTLYGAKMSTLGYAGAAAIAITAGVYTGLRYLKRKTSEKS